MEISANPHQGTRTKTAVALPQLYSMPFGKPYQPLTATIEQPCIRGKGDRLLLYGRVNADPLKTACLDRTADQARLYRDLQDQL